jgi:hypothetical protein
MADTVKAAYGSGLAALKGFAGDPGRPPAAGPTTALGDDKARRIGLTYGVGLGALLPARRLPACSLQGRPVRAPRLRRRAEVRALRRHPLRLRWRPAGLATRKASAGRAAQGGDVFVAARALLPMSFAMIVQRAAAATARRRRGA